MKKHISVLKLYMNESFGRVMAVLAVMTAGELLFFFTSGRHSLRLLDVIDSTHVLLFLGAAYMATILLIAFTPGTGGSMTMRRLSVSEKETFLMSSLAYSLWFFLLWTVQAVLIILMTKICVSSPAYAMGPQGVLAEFYRSSVIHAVMPLEETAVISRNAVICLTSGISTAYLRRRYEEGKFGTAAIWAPAMTMAMFRSRTGGYDVSAYLLIAASAFCIASIVKKNDKEESDEETR